MLRILAFTANTTRKVRSGWPEVLVGPAEVVPLWDRTDLSSTAHTCSVLLGELYQPTAQTRTDIAAHEIEEPRHAA